MIRALKHNGKLLARVCLRWIGVSMYHAGLAQLVINRSADRVRVVLYHAVEDQRSDYTKGLNVSLSPSTFALHLDYYQRYYNVLSTNALLEGDYKPATLVISFDDGYASVKDEALPLLEERGLPAVVYLIGCAVRGRMVWVNRLNQAMNTYPTETREILSDYHGLETKSRAQLIHHLQTRLEPAQIEEIVARLELAIPELANDTHRLFCTREDILEMQQRGIEFGFHSNDHLNLSKCRDSELVAQLDTRGLEPLINSNTFAYPFGYFAPAAIGKLTRSGFEKLMTVGNNTDRHSSLHLDRTEMFETSFSRMFARLEIEEPVVAAVSRLSSRLRGSVLSRKSLNGAPQKTHT